MTKRKPKTTKKKSIPTPQVPAAKKKVAAPPEPLRRWFWISTAIAGVLMLFLALQTGMNGDDEYQIDYSNKLVNYYSSGGADEAALNIPKGNMHYYGGLFDLLAGTINQMLGLDENDWAYHDIRHLLIAIFGWLAMLFTALLVKELAGWRAALLAFVLIFLSPRFLGHALMNPKDIPFAMGNVMAIYYLLRWLRSMPQPKIWDMVGLAVGIGIAFATRAGGLLLVAYLGLFAGLDFIQKYGLKQLGQNAKYIGRYAFWGISIALVGYIFAILFWPFALENPIKHPFEALSEFSELGVKIRVLFMGDNIMSDETPWHYPLTWIWKTVPLFIPIGLLAGLVRLGPLIKKYGLIAVGLILFTTFFPPIYIIYKDSILHDGWRHLYFIYPPMVAFAALAWNDLIDYFSKQPILQYVVIGVLGLTALEPAIFIARNPSFPYVYFNMANGGIKGAYGYFETDYWGVSVRQAIEEMERRGIISPDMQEPVTIVSSFSYVLQKYVSERYKGKVVTTYVKYSQRYDKEWDYAIFPSRYVRGPHLRNDTWPPSKTLFTVDANGVPLTAVLKSENDWAFQGQKAIKEKRFADAITHFEKEVQAHPDNEIAWLGLANAKINTQRPTEAIKDAEMALAVVPDNLQALSFLGLAKVNTGDVTGATEAFRRTIELDPTYAGGFYYLALISQGSGDLQSALNYAEEAIRVSPKFKAGYDLAARILDQLGQPQRAQQFRQQAQSIQ